MITNEYGTELKSIAKNAGIGALGILFMNIMAFVSNVVITRTLGADSYGLFVLATNVFGFIVIFPQLGFNNTIVRYVSYYTGKGEDAKAKGTILFGFKILLIFSLVVLAISILISPLISEYIFERPELTPLLKILLLSLPFATIALVFYSALNGLKLIKYQVIVANILNPAIFFLLIVIAFWAGFRLTGLMWVMFLMGVISLALSYYFINKKYFKYKRKLQPEVEKKELLLFAIPIYLNQFLNSAIKFAPIFIMGYFLSNKDIGIFNVGFRTAMLVSVSLSAFKLIFSPTISALFAQNNIQLINQLYKTITKWIFTIALITFCIIILFAEPVLNIFGKEFTASINVLLLLIFGELVNAGVGLVGNIIIMSGRPKVALFNAGLNFLTILTLCYLLIPVYGIIGAALSYSITVVLMNLIRLIELYYFEKMHPFKLNYFKPVVAGAIVFVIVFYAKNLTDLNQNIEMIFGTLIFLLLFVLILWAFKFDNEDKFVLGLISSKLNRKDAG
jgi:O-antigen/teichoic acid export membrane protein